jgi:hypothetical protein
MANYFIRIDESPDVRRKLLEASKSCIQVLRQHQKIQETRQQKLQMMNELRAELRGLTLLINRAEQLMPMLSDKEFQELQARHAPPKEVKKVVMKKIEIKQPVKQPDVMQARPAALPVDKLTQRLQEIERKLENI